MQSKSNYDDFGDGKYDYLGVDKRIPLHAQKAKEFFLAGNFFNAGQHARTVISLGATGWIGSLPYLEAQNVLKQLA